MEFGQAAEGRIANPEIIDRETGAGIADRLGGGKRLVMACLDLAFGELDDERAGRQVKAQDSSLDDLGHVFFRQVGR